MKTYTFTMAVEFTLSEEYVEEFEAGTFDVAQELIDVISYGNGALAESCKTLSFEELVKSRTGASDDTVRDISSRCAAAEAASIVAKLPPCTEP